MAYITQFQYYNDQANWGSYQYVTLKDIVNNFMLMHVGNNKLINNIYRHEIVWHAKRAIQELNYDAFKEIKALQLDLDDQLRFVLPADYVNWVRVSMYKGNLLLPLSQNIQANTAQEYLQDNTGEILFDENGDVLKPEFSQLDFNRIRGTEKSIYLNQNSPFNGNLGYFYEGAWYFDYIFGGRFGLNTETANQNPTFRIDNKAGVINFSSDASGQSMLLEYITDGMEGGDESLISVNKLFEKYVYAYIKAEILDNKLGVQEYIVRRAKKDKTALLRNAKIRMSDIHPGRLLMNMRGRDKIIK